MAIVGAVFLMAPDFIPARQAQLAVAMPQLIGVCRVAITDKINF
jgi:hypothetical protein